MTPIDTTRREFLASGVGLAAACACAAARLGGCKALNADARLLERGTADIFAAGTGRTLRLCPAADLAVGGQVKVVAPALAETVLVARVAEGEVRAVSIACPHWGSEVGLAGGRDKFLCPSHGSEFGLDGALQKGPAKTPLARYTVRTEAVDGKDWLVLDLPAA